MWEPLSLLFKAAVVRLAGAGSGSGSGSGLEVHPFLLASAVVHTANACLLLLTTRAVLRALNSGGGGGGIVRSAPLLNAGHALGVLCFAVHPLRVEVLGWASCLPYVLAALLAQGAVYLHLLARQQQLARHPLIVRRKWSAVGMALGSALTYGCAVLCKAAALPVVAAIVLLDCAIALHQEGHRKGVEEGMEAGEDVGGQKEKRRQGKPGKTGKTGKTGKMTPGGGGGGGGGGGVGSSVEKYGACRMWAILKSSLWSNMPSLAIGVALAAKTWTLQRPASSSFSSSSSSSTSSSSSSSASSSTSSSSSSSASSSTLYGLYGHVGLSFPERVVRAGGAAAWYPLRTLWPTSDGLHAWYVRYVPINRLFRRRDNRLFVVVMHMSKHLD